MPDDRIRELLSSPLDDRGRDRPEPETEHAERWAPSVTSGLGPWLIGAVLAGGALALLGYLLAGGGDPAATTSAVATTAATTTTTEPAPHAGGLPEGYTAVGVYGVRVERILVRPDAVFVTVSSVVPNTLDGEASAAFDGGRWALELTDGSAIESVEQSVDGTAPGFISIRFPQDPSPIAPDAIEGLRLTGLGLRTFDGFQASAQVVVTPGETTTIDLQPPSFLLDDGVTLELSSLEAGFERFAFEWSLGGGADAVAVLAPNLEITVGNDTAGLSPEGQGGGFGFFPSLANRPASDRGSFTFVGPGQLNLASADDGPATLEILMNLPVSWTIYTPVDITLPVDAASIAEAG